MSKLGNPDCITLTRLIEKATLTVTERTVTAAATTGASFRSWWTRPSQIIAGCYRRAVSSR